MNKISKIFLWCFIIFMALSAVNLQKNKIYLRQDFSLLRNFVCAVASDELKKNPEMRTIALVELENNFPSEFSREVLKCLPADVAKIHFTSEFKYKKRIMRNFSKETMIIYVADEIRWVRIIFTKKISHGRLETIKVFNKLILL